MEIYVVRHGIAIDREDPKCPPDPERYLTEEGIEKTKRVAAAVAALGATPDLLLSSPYVRAMQTAEIFASALDYSKQKIRRTDLLLPGTEPSLLFRELAKDKQTSTLFVFGHAPQLDDIIASCAGFETPHNLVEEGWRGVDRIEEGFAAERAVGLVGDAEGAAAGGEVNLGTIGFCDDW